MTRLLNYPKALAFTMGALSLFAFAPFFYWGIFCITIPFFYYLLFKTLATQNPSYKKSFYLAFAFGFGYFWAGFYWIAMAFRYEARLTSLHPYAGVVIASILIPFAFALFFGAFGLLMHFLTKNQPKNILSFPLLLTFIAVWAFLEWVRSTLFTGFPWNLAGHIFADSMPIMQLTAYIGSEALGLCSLFWAFIPFLFIGGLYTKNRRAILVALLLFVSFLAAYFLGLMRLEGHEKLAPSFKALLVQPNISQNIKMDPTQRHAMINTLLKMSFTDSETEKTAYIIWPETAILYDLTKEMKLQNLIASFLPKNTKLITGIIRHDSRNDQFFNSLIVLGSSGKIEAIYDKKHLVPFGEYVPLQGLLKFSPFAVNLGFSPGKKKSIITAIPHPFLALICYEVIFQKEICAALKKQKTDWLLTLSNDGWYGQTSGPYQHFYMARLRAVEMGIPLVRVANSGISGLIDPYGAISALLPLGESGISIAEVPKALPSSFYRNFSSILDAFYFLFVIVILIGSFCLRSFL